MTGLQAGHNCNQFARWQLMQRFSVDIGLFAHNEGETIGRVLEDLSRQTVFISDAWDARLLVLANGCTDGTVAAAHATIKGLDVIAMAQQTEVLALSKGGKSRTWNDFTHRLSRDTCEVLVFIDADIRLPDAGTIQSMAEQLRSRPELNVFVSCPVKDVDFQNESAGIIASLIARGGGTLYNFRDSICGQLYAMRSRAARQVYMPVGLPVEDGFLRAMTVTNLLTEAERLDVIDGSPSIRHVYGSIRTIPDLVRHQVRIVIGGAVNSAIFTLMRRHPMTVQQAHEMLREASSRDDWLSRMLKEELPRGPHGYVPFAFLYGRLHAHQRAGFRGTASKQIAVFAGVCLDALVYLLASLQMARRKGAGYW